MTDVTLLKSAHAADFLLFIQSLTDRAPFLLDMDEEVIAWSPGTELPLGWPTARVVSMPCTRLYTDEAVAASTPVLDLEAAKRRSPFYVEALHVRKDEPEFLAHVTTIAIANYFEAVRDLLDQLDESHFPMAQEVMGAENYGHNV